MQIYPRYTDMLQCTYMSAPTRWRKWPIVTKFDKDLIQIQPNKGIFWVPKVNNANKLICKMDMCERVEYILLLSKASGFNGD
jgi:hypothetical protein